jgi:subtilisin family serine protease
MTDKLWQISGTRGGGVRIALLDTGIDLGHSAFADSDIIVRDICNPQGDGRDIDGHGTECAGIIMQVAPQCTLLCGRILDRSGGFTYDALLGGLNWAIANNAHLVCICSGERFDDEYISRKVTTMASRGCYVVAAIGNHGRTGTRAGVYPARSPGALAIGSADTEGVLSRYTDLPADKDIFCARGELFNAPGLGGSFSEITGTSASACWMTGVLALYLSQGRERSGPMHERVQTCSTRQASERGSYWIFDAEKFLSQAS